MSTQRPDTSEDLVSPPEQVSKRRRIAFRVVATLVAIFILVQEIFGLMEIVLMWLPGDTLSSMFDDEFSEISSHRAHFMAIGITSWAVVLSMLVQLRKPDRRRDRTPSITGTGYVHIERNEPVMPDKTPASRDVLDEHYRNLADDYDEFLYYSPDFVRTLTAKMIDHLDLQKDDRLADIGCGTGIYSLDILEQIDLKHPILGVDPYPEMLAAIPDEANIEPIATTALDFSRGDRSYDKVLIKEGIHHVRNRPEFFVNIHANLPDGGRMLLVHVPPDVDYPLFKAALERCLHWHADPDELEAQLIDNGFTVDRDAVDIQHEIPTSHYLRMVENCYMSVLTSFDKDELEAGLKEMRDRYGNEDILRFVDHFDYLTAVKTA